jgi:hypothetical protein
LWKNFVYEIIRVNPKSHSQPNTSFDCHILIVPLFP